MSYTRYLTLWAINAPLDLASLLVQLDEMKQLGFDGAVFHPRFYPNEPKYLNDEYLKIVSDVIEHAREIGMEIWIYDENGWPSGTVGGKLGGFKSEAQHGVKTKDIVS